MQPANSSGAAVIHSQQAQTRTVPEWVEVAGGAELPMHSGSEAIGIITNAQQKSAGLPGRTPSPESSIQKRSIEVELTRLAPQAGQRIQDLSQSAERSVQASGQATNQAPSPADLLQLQSSAATTQETGTSTLVNAALTHAAQTPLTMAESKLPSQAHPASMNAFDGIDSGGTSTPLQSWLRADAHQVEAGYQDPALGWVEVRARDGAGGVHATLTPATQDAAASLGEHLSGLSNYLVERETPVAQIHLESVSFMSGGSGHGHNTGAGGEAGQGSHYSSNQVSPAGGEEKKGSRENSSEPSTLISTSTSRTSASLNPAFNSVDSSPLSPADGSYTSGSRVSLMA
jgi:hypothetical protein